MQKYFEIIKANPLFVGIDSGDFMAMLGCVQGRVQRCAKGAVLLLAGNPVTTVGLVLTGRVQVLREEMGGKPHLVTELTVGELFGEVFACAGVTHSPVSVVAAESSEVLHLDYRRVISTCSSSCVFHRRLIENMLALVARKNLMLNQKLELLSKRTTRERLLLFFDQCRQGERVFTLPYNREALAAYLCVERSAMSAELSKMKRDGLIRYNRNSFELLG